MAVEYQIVQGDTAPSLTDTLTYSNGDDVDLTGATVELIMRSMTSVAPLTLTGEITIPEPIAGAVQYDPSAADTATSGQFMASWAVTFPDERRMTFPTVGYITVSIEPSLLTAGGEQLVSLPDVKSHLGIDPGQKTEDAKLIRCIQAVRPVVENITGPIIQQAFEEWHDGGRPEILLRRRPSSGRGTSPVVTLIGCEEFIGTTKYPLAIVSDPAQGTMYSVQLGELARVTRRTAGGGLGVFAAGQNSVHVWYQAGQREIPANVHEGTLELIRVNYQTTQPVGRGRMTVADDEDTGVPLGFFVPRRVRELLQPNRRHPSVA